MSGWITVIQAPEVRLRSWIIYSSEKSMPRSTNTHLAISFQVKDHNSYESKLNSCKKTEEKNRLKRDLNP